MRIARLSILVGVTVAMVWISSAQAGWHGLGRFFGECWSDGYHAPGDRWGQPPRHYRPLPPLPLGRGPVIQEGPLVVPQQTPLLLPMPFKMRAEDHR